MKSFKTTLSALILTLSIGLSMPSYAIFGVGDIVFDPTQAINAARSIGNEIRSLANQAKQIANEIRSLENEALNLVKPAIDVYDAVNQPLNELRSVVSTLDYYRYRLNNTDSYLAKFQTIDGWRSHPCFQKSCTQPQLKALYESIAFGSESSKHGNDSLIRSIDKSQDAINHDAKELERLQSAARGADGNLEALGYGNMLAAKINAQLLQMRAANDAQYQAIAARQQALMDFESMRWAAGEALREDTTSVVDSGKTWGFGK